MSLHTYCLECSRAPAGVAATRMPVAAGVPDELALAEALRSIAEAAREHHGEDMVPSTDPADYITVKRDVGPSARQFIEGDTTGGRIVRVYLRPEHPWWDGPVAARVARRNHVEPDAWRRMNELAGERGADPTTIRVAPALDLGELYG